MFFPLNSELRNTVYHQNIHALSHRFLKCSNVFCSLCIDFVKSLARLLVFRFATESGSEFRFGSVVTVSYQEVQVLIQNFPKSIYIQWNLFYDLATSCSASAETLFGDLQNTCEAPKHWNSHRYLYNGKIPDLTPAIFVLKNNKKNRLNYK
jgi:hypothetical protein